MSTRFTVASHAETKPAELDACANVGLSSAWNCTPCGGRMSTRSPNSGAGASAVFAAQLVGLAAPPSPSPPSPPPSAATPPSPPPPSPPSLAVPPVSPGGFVPSGVLGLHPTDANASMSPSEHAAGTRRLRTEFTEEVAPLSDQRGPDGTTGAGACAHSGAGTFASRDGFRRLAITVCASDANPIAGARPVHGAQAFGFQSTAPSGSQTTLASGSQTTLASGRK